MHKITEITRRDIFDIIKNGFDSEGYIFDLNNLWEEPQKEIIHEYMPYYGRLTELEFLSRLYNLKELPSSDSRFDNAYNDIYCHTISYDDWPEYWVLDDERFQLQNGYGDEPLLRFICEMLHPVVRKKDSPWKEYLNEFNVLLERDGYELYVKDIISDQEVYDYREKDVIEISRDYTGKEFYPLHMIGEGSYATVYKYKDKFYDKYYALKRAKKDLNDKELQRFRIEYEQMKRLRSPYVVDVYSYNNDKNEYIMEYMDSTLDQYIDQNNSTLNMQQRGNIITQLIYGCSYIHSKNIYHRDISYNNVLIKSYDDTISVKLSDFGLVKLADSDLTSDNSEVKGYLNDPALRIKGFNSYDLLDEIYALTSLITYIITGKKNFDNIKEMCVKKFWKNGTCTDRTKRYQTLDELKQAALICMNDLQKIR